MTGRNPFLRVRPVLQMEAAECGTACLAMVLGFYGHWAPLAELREHCGTSRDGNSALDLLRAARRLGLEGRGLSVPLGKLGAVQRPAILHWDLNHFVVLEAVRKRDVTIVDPAFGRRVVHPAELDGKFSGVVIELGPGKGFAKRARVSLSLARYRNALLGAKGTLAFVLAANVPAQALAVTFPAATQILIDHVICPRRDEWLLAVLGVVALGAIIRLFLVTLQGGSQALLSARVGLTLTTELGRHLLSVPLPFLDCRSHGDLLERVRQQGALQSLVARIAHAGFEIVFVVMLAGLMVAYDWGLGTLALAMIVARTTVVRLLGAPAEQRFAAELAAVGRERSVLMEATGSPEMIKGLGLEDRVAGKYERRITERALLSIESERLQANVGACLAVLGGLMEAVILWHGGSRVINGQMTIGEFGGFLALRALVEAPLGNLVGLFEDCLQLRGALERSDDILSVSVPTTGSERAAELTGCVELRNVGFRYGSGAPWVLRHVNATIRRGERVVIVGPSGQGKSTLARLICGLLQPVEGEVLLDGKPVAAYDPDGLARQIGIVLQDAFIWPGTIKEVLALRVPEATLTAIRNAAQRACFDEVVERLPDRYDAILERNGSNLSGGERQRLALAQALVGNPRLLVLDEATCALDPRAERRVLDQLDTVPSTIVSVAHREAVITRAERIFEVRGGAVVLVEASGRRGHREAAGGGIVPPESSILTSADGRLP